MLIATSVYSTSGLYSQYKRFLKVLCLCQNYSEGFQMHTCIHLEPFFSNKMCYQVVRIRRSLQSVFYNIIMKDIIYLIRIITTNIRVAFCFSIL